MSETLIFFHVFWGVYRNQVCPYFSLAQILLNKWTGTDETLHSCSLQPKDVYGRR